MRLPETILAIAAFLAVCSCSEKTAEVVPSMSFEISDISSSGCVIGVTLADGAENYSMVVLPASSYTEAAALDTLLASPSMTAASRVIERLHGTKDFVVAAMPFSGSGVHGEMTAREFTLTDFDLDLKLYTPQDGDESSLNRYNTIRIDAYSNGLPESGSYALALTDAFRLLSAQKGRDAAIREILTENSETLSRQKLEEMADRTPYKSDLFYITGLSAGTSYTLVMSLTDLDGGEHLFSFEGSTKARE